MTGPDFCDAVRREHEAIAACLEEGDLRAPVRHCGGWTLLDLADHLGRGNVWAAGAITEQRGDIDPPPAPTGRAELVAWFRAGCTTLDTALANDPDAPAWTLWPPRTVAFWRRRRAHEAMVHRFDAEHTIGRVSRLDPVLAGDGVAEVVEVMHPRQVEKGRAAAPEVSVRLRATDLCSDWQLGPGMPVAELSGSAEVLLLALWGRLRYDDPAITWEGDTAAATRLLGEALTP